ncbi:MAG: AzlD domain-containing protein [Candidatus Limnocylindrales bacterium]
MSTDLVLLALLMGAVTYPSRALPLLAPGIERLPPMALAYLQLVGPAVLAALAAASVFVVRPGLPIGLTDVMPALAVLVAVVVVRWRHSVILGIAVAVVIVAIQRAVWPA